MREICQSGSMSGNRKQSYAQPDCGGPCESTPTATGRLKPLRLFSTLLAVTLIGVTERYRLWLLKSPHTRNERTKNDGEHTIHSNDDLQHSAHCISVRPGPDDQLGWTYLESHQRWYGRRRSPGSGQCCLRPTIWDLGRTSGLSRATSTTWIRQRCSDSSPMGPLTTLAPTQRTKLILNFPSGTRLVTAVMPTLQFIHPRETASQMAFPAGKTTSKSAVETLLRQGWSGDPIASCSR